jgi:hypothetical protein
MRNSIALSVVLGLVILTPAVASAASLALSEHAAMMKSARATSAGIEQVRQRYRVRRCGRYARRTCSSWTRMPYWRPYHYRYWKFYYPYGGPLF